MIKLTVVPCAGLANRINCIMSAWELLEHYEAEIDIYWENTPDCAADFNDLFMPISREHLTMHNTTPFHLKAPSKKNLYIPKIIRKALFDKQYHTIDFRNVNLEDIMDKDMSIYIHGHNRFCEFQRASKIGEILKPVNEIQTRIDEILSLYSEYTVGVHVRRTDNKLAIQNNPIAKYFAYMDKELEVHPGCKFYIATDSLDVKGKMKNRYQGRIVTGQWNLSRSSRQGIKDAVADIYCLGGCSKIVGSTNSTFSFLASKLFDTPMIE